MKTTTNHAHHIISLLAVWMCSFANSTGEVFYATDFDSLRPGFTEYQPGDPNHDGWFLVGAGPLGYGEIQDTIANSGRALHEHAAVEAGSGAQTIDNRAIMPPDLSQYPLITLEADFYASTSNPDARNSFAAALEVSGGPHPGYYILGFGLSSGNGAIKREAGVNVELTGFNGVDNNGPVPLTTGKGLAWDSWHHLKLVINQREDRYVSLTVDGQTEMPEGFGLPRSVYEGQWNRGQLIEAIQAVIVPVDNFDEESDDDVYWDNIMLYGECDLRADLTGDCKVTLEDLSILAAEWLMGT